MKGIKLNRFSENSFSTPQKSKSNSKDNKSDSEFSTKGRSTHDKSFSKVSEDSLLIPKNTALLSSRKVSLKLHRQQKIKRKQALKQTLGNMILVRKLNYKTVFQNLRSLMSRKKVKYENGERKIIQNMIWKTKLNLEMSLVRSMLKLQNLPLEQQTEQKQIKKSHIFSKQMNTNLTIYPDENSAIKIKQREAILTLIPFADKKVRKVIRKFEKNAILHKMSQKYHAKSKRQEFIKFIQKLRLIIKTERQLILSTKRKTVSNLLNKCFQRRDRIFYEKMRTCNILTETKKKSIIQKMNIKAELRKITALALWKKKISSVKKEDYTFERCQEVSISPKKNFKKKQSQEVQEVEIQTELLELSETSSRVNRNNLLQRIITKQYLQKWHFHARFRRNLQRCAIKLACTPTISVQRSFWRLNIHAYSQKK